MLIVPLQPVANQTIAVILGNQNCGINVVQKSTGTFLTLAVNNVPIVTTAICLDRVRIVRTAYLGFIGDLSFIDTQGFDVPQYTGLGTRWQLIYLTATDLV